MFKETYEQQASNESNQKKGRFREVAKTLYEKWKVIWDKNPIQQRADKEKFTQIEEAQRGINIYFSEDRKQFKDKARDFLLEPRITFEQVVSIFFETYKDEEYYLHEPDALSDFFSKEEIVALLIQKVEQLASADNALQDTNRSLIIKIASALLRKGIGSAINLINEDIFNQEQRKAAYESLFDRSQYRDYELTYSLLSRFSYISEVGKDHCEIASSGFVFLKALLSMLQDIGTEWDALDADLKDQIRKNLNQELRYILGISEWPFKEKLNSVDKSVFQEISLREAKQFLQNSMQEEILNLPEELKKDINQLLVELHSKQKLQSYNLDFVRSFVPLEELVEEYSSPIAQLIFLKQKAKVPFLPQEFGFGSLEKISKELSQLVVILSNEDDAERLAPILKFFSSPVGHTKNLYEALEGRDQQEKAEYREKIKKMVHNEPFFSILARIIYRTGQYRKSFMRALLCGWCDGNAFYEGLTDDEKEDVLFTDNRKVNISSGNSMQLCSDAENRMETAVFGGTADAGLNYTKPLEAVVPWFARSDNGTDLSKTRITGIVKYYGRPVALCTQATVTPNGVFLPGTWWTQVGEGIDTQILKKGYVSLDDKEQLEQPWILFRTSYLSFIFEKKAQHNLIQSNAIPTRPDIKKFNDMYGAG